MNLRRHPADQISHAFLTSIFSTSYFGMWIMISNDMQETISMAGMTNKGTQKATTDKYE